MLKENILIEIGLSRNESKVYLALLDIGLSTATKISYKSKIHRSNVYESLERLLEKGLVKYITKDKKKLFEASNPISLLDILKEKQTKLQEILPNLLLKENSKDRKIKVNIYEGIISLRLLLYKFLNYKKPIFIFGIPKDTPEKLEDFIMAFHKERINKKIVMKLIYNYDALNRIKFLNKLKCTQARRLPKEYDSSAATLICDKKLLLIMWACDPILIIEIENKDLTDSYTRYFTLLWGTVK